MYVPWFWHHYFEVTFTYSREAHLASHYWLNCLPFFHHYNDVIMTDGISIHQHNDCLLNRIQAQIKENIKASRHWPLCHRWPMNSPYKGPVTQKVFPFVFQPTVIMIKYIIRHLYGCQGEAVEHGDRSYHPNTTFGVPAKVCRWSGRICKLNYIYWVWNCNTCFIFNSMRPSNAHMRQ